MSAYVIYHQAEVTDAEGWEAYRSKIRELGHGGNCALLQGRMVAQKCTPTIRTLIGGALIELIPIAFNVAYSALIGLMSSTVKVPGWTNSRSGVFKTNCMDQELGAADEYDKRPRDLLLE